MTKATLKSREEVNSLKFNDLLKFAKTLGIKYNNHTKAQMLEEVHSKIGELMGVEKVIEAPKVEEVPVEEIAPQVEPLHQPKGKKEKKEVVDVDDVDKQKLDEILQQDLLSKSDKMRKLYEELGLGVKQIADLTNSHYSFTYGVIDRLKKGSKKES